MCVCVFICQGSKRVLRSNEIILPQRGLLDTDLDLSFSLQVSALAKTSLLVFYDFFLHLTVVPKSKVIQDTLSNYLSFWVLKLHAENDMQHCLKASFLFHFELTHCVCVQLFSIHISLKVMEIFCKLCCNVGKSIKIGQYLAIKLWQLVT